MPAGTHDALHYRGRVVIAVKDGTTRVFGPVHTASGLLSLSTLVQNRGYEVQGDARLSSLAELKTEMSMAGGERR